MPVKVIKPQSVCAREMVIEYNDEGVITNAGIIGGCQGNTQGVSKLIEGRKISEVVALLEGIKCRGSRTGETSCPDQLAKGLKELLK